MRSASINDSNCDYADYADTSIGGDGSVRDAGINNWNYDCTDYADYADLLLSTH